MPSPRPSTAERREAARQKAAALRRQQAARERRTRVITFSALGVALVALCAAAVYVLVQAGGSDDAASAGSTAVPLAEVTSAPTVALADGGIPITADGVGGAVDPDLTRVDVYVDFMCPGCAYFEQSSGATFTDLAATGTATVVYHPVAILDRLSQGTAYSTRASSAAALVAEEAPEQFEVFVQTLFANQPDENSTGLTDEEIAGVARLAGVPEASAARIGDGTATDRYGAWVLAATTEVTADAALTNPEQGGFTSPTMALDGVRWAGDWSDPDAVLAAITG
jgi:protein-disulfide isomerase